MVEEEIRSFPLDPTVAFSFIVPIMKYRSVPVLVVKHSSFLKNVYLWRFVGIRGIPSSGSKLTDCKVVSTHLQQIHGVRCCPESPGSPDCLKLDGSPTALTYSHLIMSGFSADWNHLFTPTAIPLLFLLSRIVIENIVLLDSILFGPPPPVLGQFRHWIQHFIPGIGFSFMTRFHLTIADKSLELPDCLIAIRFCVKVVFQSLVRLFTDKRRVG